jgi:hypothetical protein
MVLVRRDQLYTISEGIVNVAAPNTWDVVHFFDGNVGICERCKQGVIVLAANGRMSFLRWTKFRLDSEVDLYGTTLKPAAATLCQLRGLGNFRHSQNSRKKRASLRLLPRRHGELHVVDGNKFRSGVR